MRVSVCIGGTCQVREPNIIKDNNNSLLFYNYKKEHGFIAVQTNQSIMLAMDMQARDYRHIRTSSVVCNLAANS